MNLFTCLDFETKSTCNRVCPTCIRNSHPNREAVSSWFAPNYLSESLIYEAAEQAIEMGFTGQVCLSHYNEPLMDERIPRIASVIKAYGVFERVFLNTNGDFIKEDLAKDLDGTLDRMIVTLYMDEPAKSKRAAWISSLFHQTEIQIITKSDHIPTHFSPKFPVKEMALRSRNSHCFEPAIHLIINHRGQYLLCCEDVIGNFDLGKFPDISLQDYWYGKRAEIQEKLSGEGGRHWHSYCTTCPRT